LAESVLVETYGCTLNQADSDIMQSLLQNAGYSVSTRAEPGAYGDFDYVVLNTCTVKGVTEQRILDRISRLKGKGRKLVVAGCLASASPEKIRRIAPESTILSTRDIDNVVNALETGNSFAQRRSADKAGLLPLYGNVITRIPISEGCLSSCSFCETKFARGSLNSFSEDVIVRAIEMNVKAGAKEIELASQDTGAYGLDRNTNIANLLSRVSEIEGQFRVRVGMLNPEHLHRYFDDLAYALNDNRIYKFLHLPVQSGSDRILSAMSRHYTVDEYVGYCREAKRRVNGLNIATDVIVGYPAETEEDFAETLNLLKAIRPNITNISRFAARPHARASRLKQLRTEIIKQRSIEASRLSREIQTGIRKGFIGQRRRVLITEKGKSMMGRDDSYYQISITSGHAVIGEFIDAEIIGVSPGSMLGKMVLPD
jgi:MiaB-like tRNA modifying enzyme